jgi:rubrerythrin
MQEFKSDDEILEYATSRESAAHRFYMDLAEEMENATMRQLFENFAREELRHKSRLELEIMKRGLVVPDALGAEDLDETDAMVDVPPELGVNYKNALVLAMNRESKSFRLYVELAAIVQDKGAREALLSLAEEEARHRLRIEMEYDMVIKKR